MIDNRFIVQIVRFHEKIENIFIHVVTSSQTLEVSATLMSTQQGGTLVFAGQVSSTLSNHWILA